MRELQIWWKKNSIYQTDCFGEYDEIEWRTRAWVARSNVGVSRFVFLTISDAVDAKWGEVWG
eukprot:10748057-Lingulodinium_polyedra.AAC.1